MFTFLLSIKLFAVQSALGTYYGIWQ
ncbi:Putative uncharacterized protein [Vibrio anguillarum]|nr:Putative uncharacterized protein [Vibrio anguillarum]